MSDFPPQGVGFKSDVDAMKALVARLPASARDNLKFIVSMHPARMFDPRIPGLTPVGTHHHKCMILRRGRTHLAFCGGLDISPPRTPPGWATAGFIWHDVHARLEGAIVLDLEREFVLRWNREKGQTTAGTLADWKPFENLTTDRMDATDMSARNNAHPMQMLRTVSTGGGVADVKRDDIWQGYLKLVGAARRFLFIENQYIREPVLADAIVVQAQANPELIVMIVVSKETDDPDNLLTETGRALQHQFFTRLFAGIPAARRRVYAMHQRLVHSKLLLVDDRALTIGSANANPRGFFMDSELNVMVDNLAMVRDARHELWSHDLNVQKSTVAGWTVGEFFAKWDAVAQANSTKLQTPNSMVGEGVIPFDPLTVKGNRSPLIPDVLTET
jgi:phosphatidylserine/phosphatidylglycerophosphate/cardiolipin synthase-like enzyme